MRDSSKRAERERQRVGARQFDQARQIEHERQHLLAERRTDETRAVRHDHLGVDGEPSHGSAVAVSTFGPPEPVHPGPDTTALAGQVVVIAAKNGETVPPTVWKSPPTKTSPLARTASVKTELLTPPPKPDQEAPFRTTRARLDTIPRVVLRQGLRTCARPEPDRSAPISSEGWTRRGRQRIIAAPCRTASLPRIST